MYRRCVLLAFLMCSIATGLTWGFIQAEEPPSPEALAFMSPMPLENANSDHRKVSMYEFLVALQQQHQRLLEPEVRGREIGEEFPLSLPLQDKNQYFEDKKRGSYMSICHFKICNMGRKRSAAWFEGSLARQRQVAEAAEQQRDSRSSFWN